MCIMYFLIHLKGHCNIFLTLYWHLCSYVVSYSFSDGDCYRFCREDPSFWTPLSIMLHLVWIRWRSAPSCGRWRYRHRGCCGCGRSSSCKSVMRAGLSTRPSFLRGVIPSPVMPDRNEKLDDPFPSPCFWHYLIIYKSKLPQIYQWYYILCKLLLLCQVLNVEKTAAPLKAGHIEYFLFMCKVRNSRGCISRWTISSTFITVCC